MGFFSKKTPEEKANKKEKSVAFMGAPLQPIGKIPMNKLTFIKLNPIDKVMIITHEKIEITLPYDRIRGFKIDSETTLAKSGGTIGRALVGGALFGGAGAVVGGMSGKGNTKTKWIATLSYVDKDGKPQELLFLQWGLTGPYEGERNELPFEKVVNEIVSRYSEDITEL